MKKLYLIRHAKSSWDNLDLKDIDRPLNKRGEKDAPRMAKRLKEKDIHPDVMISSPAKRARETCHVIAKVLDFPEANIKIDKQLYHANEDQLLRVVKGIKDLKDSEEVVLIFGHNPGLMDFANSLLSEDIENIPTCGVVGSTLEIKSWKDASFGCGEMTLFDFPKNKED